MTNPLTSLAILLEGTELTFKVISSYNGKQAINSVLKGARSGPSIGLATATTWIACVSVAIVVG